MSRMAKGLAVAGILAAVVIAIVITLVSVNAASSGASTAEEIEAICVLNAGPAGSSVRGTLVLKQSCPDGEVHITGNVTGLKSDTMHGFHIHQSGDLRNPTNPCLSTGGHYNPFNKKHGAPQDVERHVGDLGNIKSDASGLAEVDITDRIVKLCGEHSVIGRAFVVHEMTDDLGRDGGDSQVTGNAGGRAGCGLIGVIYKP